MEFIKHNRVAQLVIAGIVVFLIWFTAQLIILQKAHSTLENYAAFRGCTAITNRSDASATCMNASGQAITLVQFRDRWYLDGDLPTCIGNFCF